MDLLGSIFGAVNDVANRYWQAGFGIYDRIHQAQNDAWTKEFSQSQFDWQRDAWQQQFDYVKQQNQLMMEREDTAVQRRVQDLEAAGISPLALSQGGVSTNTPVSAPSATSSPAGALSSGASGFSPVMSQFAQMQFQADENQKQRDFLEQENERNRKWKSGESALDRTAEQQRLNASLQNAAGIAYSQIKSNERVASGHDSATRYSADKANEAVHYSALLNVTELNRANTVKELLETQRFIQSQNQLAREGLDISHPISDLQDYKDAVANWYNRYDAFMTVELGVGSWSSSEGATRAESGSAGAGVGFNRSGSFFGGGSSRGVDVSGSGSYSNSSGYNRSHDSTSVNLQRLNAWLARNPFPYYMPN